MNRLLFLGLLGLALVCVFCLYCRAPAIEEDLRGKALACLDDAGLNSELLTVSGRDATLSGSVASPVLGDGVEACISAIPGIRVVTNRLEIAGLEPSRPIASNAPPDGQHLNCRTEFHALKES
jgi:hypothetical protein